MSSASDANLQSRLRDLEVFTFAWPQEPDEDPTGKLAYKAMCEKLDHQEGGFCRFPITSVVDRLDQPDVKLQHCGIGDKGAQALAETIKINHSIVSLDLTDNHLTPAGSEHLIQALVGNKTVKVLNLAENRLGVSALAEPNGLTIGGQIRALLMKNNTISDLSLRNNKISDRDMELIAEGVIDNVTLTRIDLSYNELGPRGAQAIANMLAHGSAEIRELNLQWNRFQQSGSLVLLKEGLQVTGTIRKMFLAWNGIGDDGGEILGQIIGGSSVLEEVDVSHNRIGAKGAEAIAKGITESSTLVRLVLADNPLKDPGCARIVAALRENKSVNAVDLRDTGAGPLTKAEMTETSLAKPKQFVVDFSRALFDHDDK